MNSRTRTLKPKPKRAKPPSATKAGKSAAARTARHAAFVAAYLTNGSNATAAAAAAGCTAREMRKAGSKLLHQPEVQRLLAASAQKVAELAGMTTERWATELRRVTYSMPGNLFGADGELIPVHLLPPDVQASIASIKFGPDGRTVLYKFWDKTVGLQIMARHMGLYERDNAQQSDIRVRVELVG